MEAGVPCSPSTRHQTSLHRDQMDGDAARFVPPGILVGPWSLSLREGLLKTGLHPSEASFFGFGGKCP